METKALEERLAAFNAAMINGDYGTVVRVVPPAIIESIANEAGLPVAELRQLVVEQTQAALRTVELIDFSMHLTDAKVGELADGAPFLLVPTATRMRVEGAGTIEARSHTLAFIEDGHWYFVRLDDASQVAILTEVYPAFAGQSFPKGTMRVIPDSSGDAGKPTFPDNPPED